MKLARYLLLSFAALVIAPSIHAGNIRPLEDFLVRQGTFCIDFVGNCAPGAPPLIFVPPIANFLGFADPGTGRSASVDYAGLADFWAGGAFGTSFSGTVIERPLADGWAMVTVLLNTENALTWVIDGDDFENGPLLFGSRAVEAADGAESALGRVHLSLKFINSAPGADLPDVLQVFFFPEPGQELLSFKANHQAFGPLREAFGVPDGTAGSAHGVQTGLLGNPQCGTDGPSAVADCFPAEKIFLRALGNRRGR